VNKVYIQYYQTALGELMLGSFSEKLCLCDWRYRKMRTAIDRRIQEGLDACFEEKDTVVTQNARQQLEEYFSINRIDFNIPLLMIGTSFQKMIWNELLSIPYGKTDSYLGISRKTGHEKSIRAVAAANGANALSIFVPCHRVIGSDGKLTGYGGGVHVKRKLLQLEMHGQSTDQLQLFR
jgi:methylated-DNA-[protein]-cysteine S-methyltransferase